MGSGEMDGVFHDDLTGEEDGAARRWEEKRNIQFTEWPVAEAKPWGR